MQNIFGYPMGRLTWEVVLHYGDLKWVAFCAILLTFLQNIGR